MTPAPSRCPGRKTLRRREENHTPDAEVQPQQVTGVGSGLWVATVSAFLNRGPFSFLTAKQWWPAQYCLLVLCAAKLPLPPKRRTHGQKSADRGYRLPLLNADSRRIGEAAAKLTVGSTFDGERACRSGAKIGGEQDKSPRSGERRPWLPATREKFYDRRLISP